MVIPLVLTSPCAVQSIVSYYLPLSGTNGHELRRFVYQRQMGGYQGLGLHDRQKWRPGLEIET